MTDYEACGNERDERGSPPPKFKRRHTDNTVIDLENTTRIPDDKTWVLFRGTGIMGFQKIREDIERRGYKSEYVYVMHNRDGRKLGLAVVKFFTANEASKVAEYYKKELLCGQAVSCDVTDICNTFHMYMTMETHSLHANDADEKYEERGRSFNNTYPRNSTGRGYHGSRGSNYRYSRND